MKGKFSLSVGATACQNCRAGKYLSSVGCDTATACVDCAKGKYSNATGATFAGTCRSCLTGKYSPSAGNTDSSDCYDCEPGSYAKAPGSTVCMMCPSGTYSTARGMSVCSLCAQGVSLPGAVHDMNCTVDILDIVITLRLYMTREEFWIVKEEYKNAIAVALGGGDASRFVLVTPDPASRREDSPLLTTFSIKWPRQGIFEFSREIQI